MQVGADAGVGKGHIPELNMGGGFFCGDQGENGHIFLGGEDLGHTLGAGFTLGIHDEDSGDAQHGVENHDEILQKGYDDTALGLTTVDPVGADEHHQGQSQIQGQGGGGVGDGGDDAGFLVHGGQLVVDGVEALLFVVGLAEGFDDPDAGDVLLDGTNHLVQHRLLAGVQRQAGLGDEIDHNGDDGKQGNENQGQHRVHSQHHGDAAQKQNRGADADALEPGKELVDVIGVAGEPGFGGGDGERVHLPGGEGLEFLE